MKSSLSCNSAVSTVAPGRPREIEEVTNRHLVHPVSRRLVDLLIKTSATPNQVSVASVFMAAAGAFCYAELAWPWGAFAGLACFFAWHVLDGADGDLARRTARASTSGELVDGICDHVSQALLYVAFAFVLQRSLGGWAWAMALAAALCHFVQANAYETGRKTYRRWVYSATWMRQDPDSLARAGAVKSALGELYLSVSNLSNRGEAQVEAAMAPLLADDRRGADTARALYRGHYAPLVKASAVLGGNTRTLAAFLSMLAGTPLWFFLFEIVVLNAALLGLVVWRRRRDRALLADIAKARITMRNQAAFAPN
jgi:phosphatidylglycerophosphate synthase